MPQHSMFRNKFSEPNICAEILKIASLGLRKEDFQNFHPAPMLLVFCNCDNRVASWNIFSFQLMTCSVRKQIERT